MKNFKRILVVNPFGIGDTIFTLHLVQALRGAFPDATIDFLCNERTERLVRLNPVVAQRFVFNRDLFRRLWRRNPLMMLRKLASLCREIRVRRHEVMFDLSLGREYAFFGRVLGIPERIGFDYKGRGVFLTRKLKLSGYAHRNVAEIQLDLLETLGAEPRQVSYTRTLWLPEEVKGRAATHLRRHGIDERGEILAIAPGGGRTWGKNARFKQWNAERFAEVANRIVRTRHWKVILIGDRQEEPLVSQVAALIETPVVTLMGEPLELVAAVLLRSRVLVCNDGGLMHLANALGVKTVAIFGPVDEKVYGPSRQDVPHEVLVQEVPCRPCYSKFHFPVCAHNRRCLEELPVQKVLDALQKIA